MKPKTRKRSAEKSTVKSTATIPLIPQPHGGALKAGGTPGNAGGGRPKDEVREKLAQLANGKGFHFLDQLMEGKARFRLVGTCGKCGHENNEALSKAEMDAMWDEITATVDHRLKANDQILKYGLGQKDEVEVTNHPEVQRFVSAHAQATLEIAGADVYKKIAARVKELAA